MSARIKILLVDDDKDDQLFFIDALNEVNPGVDCGLANNGLEAIDHLHKIPPPPTVIFLDLNMPYMGGLECLAIIKKDLNYKDIPVLVLSTSSNIEDKQRSLDMGAYLFLTKPSDFSSLKSNIQSVLLPYIH